MLGKSALGGSNSILPSLIPPSPTATRHPQPKGVEISGGASLPRCESPVEDAAGQGRYQHILYQDVLLQQQQQQQQQQQGHLRPDDGSHDELAKAAATQAEQRKEMMDAIDAGSGVGVESGSPFADGPGYINTSATVEEFPRLIQVVFRLVIVVVVGLLFLLLLLLLFLFYIPSSPTAHSQS
ncbi:hypothetical protein DFJ73DRAFT_775942 [Zopfochytrium polystomum]|nr:hypothetical protein DFJ73DRAFT_775942 [Zopfochytrium polystomum]